MLINSLIFKLEKVSTTFFVHLLNFFISILIDLLLIWLRLVHGRNVRRLLHWFLWNHWRILIWSWLIRLVLIWLIWLLHHLITWLIFLNSRIHLFIALRQYIKRWLSLSRNFFTTIIVSIRWILTSWL